MGAAPNTVRSIDPSPTIATSIPAHQHREGDDVRTPDEAHNAVLLPLGEVSEMEVSRQTDRRGAASVNTRPGRNYVNQKAFRDNFRMGDNPPTWTGKA
jgi:hypothetical protein